MSMDKITRKKVYTLRKEGSQEGSLNTKLNLQDRLEVTKGEATHESQLKVFSRRKSCQMLV